MGLEMHSQGYIRVRGSENCPRYLALQRTCAKHVQQILTDRNVIRETGDSKKHKHFSVGPKKKKNPTKDLCNSPVIIHNLTKAGLPQGLSYVHRAFCSHNNCLPTNDM